jgi:effector-binding domain-containing protein
MKIEIITNELTLNIFGFSGTAANKDYTGTAFRLMDKIWPIVKANNLKHKGMNIWVYEPNHKVFAGIEFESAPDADLGFEHKIITLTRYGYYKHIGPYNQIKQAGDNLRSELRKNGLEPTLPYIEIYGHWNNDETKLETELLMVAK